MTTPPTTPATTPPSSSPPEAAGDVSARPVKDARPVRLRYSQTALLAVLIAAFGAIPFALSAAPWGLLALVPLVVAAYLLIRVGATITTEDVVIHGAFYTRRVPRPSIIGMDVPDGRHVFLARTDGMSIMLPTARPRDLPRLRELLFGVPRPQPTEQ